ncbi:MAG: GT4 family glycosyltransferase PelF [Acidobacteria bacterium]|nr:GT4 family glycosyltransferase PelF [Acidobacteriota bacterium]
MNPISVLLTSEGTYPCYGGGVSVWCDHLVRGLSDVNFHVFAVTHAPSQPHRFTFPENLKSCRTYPLWGTDEPGEQDDFFPTCVRKLRTTSEVIRAQFIDPFETALGCVLSSKASPEVLATALVRLQSYFKQYDYAQTMASMETWDGFLKVCSAIPQDGQVLNIEDATTCMRWLQRYMGVLSAPLPDVDITHASMAGLAALPGTLLKVSRQVPFLLTEHGIYLRELYMYLSRAPYSMPSKRFLVSLNRALVRLSYHYADRVTCICGFNRRWQIRLGADPKKITTVPNGADPAIFHPRPSAGPRRPTVLTMARIFPLKGLETLFHAAAQVRLRVPNVLFRVLGEASDQQYYAKCLALVRSLDLTSSVEFGHVPNPAEAYAQCDVFCLPSISEGLPYSVIEAMLTGCPIVASDVGGVGEMLSGAGLLVTPGDVKGLAENLLTLLEDTPAAADRRRALSSAALARAREVYALDSFRKHFREIYHGLALDKDDARLPQPTESRQFAFAAAGRL